MYGRLLDKLHALSDDEASSSEGSDQEDQTEQPAAKKVKGADKVDLAALRQHGFSSGPSVLYVPPPTADGEANWNW